MSVLVRDLLNDLQIAIAAVRVAEKNRAEAEKSVIAGLEAIGKPLVEKGCVVIGDTMLKRPYMTLPLEVSAVTNVPVDLVVDH
jgi:hypothetical protein